MRERVVPLVLCLVLPAGCSEVIEPGHRGLLFQPWRGGLLPQDPQPRQALCRAYGRVDDFDVTYSTRSEAIRTISSEGLALGVRVSVIYRPAVAELYELDVEIGRNYYEEVIGPEFKTATRGVFARHSYLDVQRNNAAIEEEIRADVRRRIAGRHVEISSVTMEEVNDAPEIAEAIRAKLVGEQESVRKKVALENDALRRQAEAQARGGAGQAGGRGAAPAQAERAAARRGAVAHRSGEGGDRSGDAGDPGQVAGGAGDPAGQGPRRGAQGASAGPDPAGRDDARLRRAGQARGRGDHHHAKLHLLKGSYFLFPPSVFPHLAANAEGRRSKPFSDSASVPALVGPALASCGTAQEA